MLLAGLWLLAAAAFAAGTEQAEEVFESVYGAAVKRVKGTADTQDDADLASRLLEVAQTVTGPPGFLALLCERACDLASGCPSGQETAVAAMELLAARAPDRAGACAERVVAIRRKQYDARRGMAKSVAGEVLIDALLAAVDARAQAGQHDALAPLYRQARGIAAAIQDPRLKEIEAETQAATETAKVARDVAAAKALFKKNPADKVARETLVRLYLVGLDDPAEAAKYASGLQDPSLRKYVPAAARPLEEVPELACRELAERYRTLADRAANRAKAAMLLRAKAYGERFLRLHPAEDLDRTAVLLVLGQVREALERLRSPARPRGKWIDLAKQAHPTRDAVAGPWARTVAGLEVAPSPYARLMLPPVPEGAYDLTVRFVRAKGSGPILVNVPTGTTAASVVLDAQGGLYGFEVIRGKGMGGNETRAQLGPLTNGRQYLLVVCVDPQADQVSVRAALDGKTIVSWRGPQSVLQVGQPWGIPSPDAVGLCTYATHTAFGSARFRLRPGQAGLLR